MSSGYAGPLGGAAAGPLGGAAGGPLGGAAGGPRPGTAVRSRALDRHAHVTRAADRARLVDREPHPFHVELLEDEERRAVSERLDELEARCLDECDDALRELLVVERIRHLVGKRRSRAVDRQLEIDDDGLLDAPLPFDEADDALDGEAAQEDGIRR